MNKAFAATVSECIADDKSQLNPSLGFVLRWREQEELPSQKYATSKVPIQGN